MSGLPAFADGEKKIGMKYITETVISKKTVCLTAALVLLASTSLRAETVQRPDGSIEVEFNLEGGGKPQYEISLKGKTVLEPPPLGLETSIGSFAGGLKLADTSVRTIEEDYVLPHGKVRDVHYEANELTVRLTNGNNDTLETVFRVSNRDVAFSYRISARDKFRIVIKKELSGFAKTKPSYEEGFD